MAVTVRPIHPDELATFLGVQRTAMLMPPASEALVEARRASLDLVRCLLARDGDVPAGATRDFATRLTVPGGGSVPAAAVSAVGVLPTHRRRGLLSQLMARQLGDAAERGEVVSMLVSADYPIYGRFGYGVATEACSLRFDVLTAELLHPATGTAALVADMKVFRDVLVGIYGRAAARTPGHMTWPHWMFNLWVGLVDVLDGQDEARRDAVRVVWSDEAGTPQGALSYNVTEDWPDNRPRGRIDVRELYAATDEAERELYRHIASVDWAATAHVGLRPVDDPLPFRLVDGRGAVLADRSDHIWARVLDVPAALGARTYALPGTLVVEVVDPGGPAAGRFLLDAGPDGATVATTDRSPDVTVPVDVLGSTLLGGVPWGRLAGAGRVDEHTPGAVARATALFTTPRAPYCPTPF
jgi:predicted acetyltransferase